MMSHHFRIISHPTRPTCYTGLTFQSQSFLIESHFILRVAQVLARNDVSRKEVFDVVKPMKPPFNGIVFMYKKTLPLMVIIW